MSGPNREKNEPLEDKHASSSALGFGTSFAVGMALFGLGGHWLDQKFDREPLLTLIGIGMGLLYGAWELWKLVTATNEQIKQADRKRAETKEKESHETPQ